MEPTRERTGRRRGAIVVVVLALAAVGFGVYWFAPQNLLLNRSVDEALPTAPAAGTAEPDDGDDGKQPQEGSDAQEPDEPAELSRGAFRSLEHSTSGDAVILELSDGSRILRLEDLETSNGPDVRVWLSDRAPSDDWYIYDDGEFVDLGGLKGNVGSSNYEIPPDVDLSRFGSAVVWCRRFAVGFGVAPVDTP